MNAPKKPRKVALPKESEDGLQGRIREALELQGYEVARLSRVRHKCWQCGAWPKKGDGVEIGRVADLLVRKRDWPKGICLQLEVKLPGGDWSSDDQRIANEQGWTVRIESHEEALAAMSGLEEER